jgi:trigger factor
MADVEPVSEPAISAGSPSAGTPFKYTASIEVRPAIELPDLQGLPAIRPEVVVADSEVDDKLEELRNSNAPIIEEEKGTEVAQGHFVTMDFVGRIDGEPFEGGSGQGQQLEIGSGRFIPGFEDQLVGAVAGDDRDVQVSFPEDYGSPEFAGKAASFAVHVVDVRRREVPELDDEFAKDLGDFDSLDALRDRIRADLESTQEREAKETFRTSLMDGLLERAEFDVPPGMVDRQLESQLQAASRRLEGQVDPDAVRGQMERWREDWRPRAERDVREMLLLQAIGDSEGIEVEEEELTARIEELMGGESGGAAQFEELQKDEQLRKALTMQL